MLLKHELHFFASKTGGQFATECPGQFEPGTGGHFKPESDGQIERNLQSAICF